VGGAAVLLWHNTAYDALDYSGQRGVFEASLDLAVGGSAWTGTLTEALNAYGHD
jgi:hypothetical protein